MKKKVENMKESEMFKTTTGTNVEKSVAFSNLNKGLDNESTADELKDINTNRSPSRSSGSPKGPTRTKNGLIHMPKLIKCPLKENKYSIRLQQKALTFYINLFFKFFNF